MPEPREIAELAVKCAFDKKGTNITIMDMEDSTVMCDYFVLINGSSRPHTKAIAEHIDAVLEEKLGIKEKKIQGKESGSWVLMDYGTVVIHIFLENIRKYYDLEGLWNKAKVEYPEIEIPQPEIKN